MIVTMTDDQKETINFLINMLASGILFCEESKKEDDLAKRLGFFTSTARLLLDDIDAVCEGESIDMKKYEPFQPAKAE